MHPYSLEYIVAFVLLFWVYWLAGKTKNIQNIILLVVSYAFYASWNWKCLPLLFLVSMIAYLSGRYLSVKSDDNRSRRKWWIACLAVSIELSILAVFKYADFFISSLDSIAGVHLTAKSVIFPLGISFYTFSSISYIVDCYHEKVDDPADLTAVLLFLSFFPSILSGPINRATKQLPQFQKKRSFAYQSVIEGFKDFVWGTFVKLCVADRVGMYIDAVYGNVAQHSGVTLFVTSILYSIQIYADFSGYSLMAIGCGKMLGIKLETNFIRPLLSKTLSEFWRKWHISLTSWLRDYLYIPLGGNRVSGRRWALNVVIVFVISGLWHGASFSFIIWGAIHGVALVLERLILGDPNKSDNNHSAIHGASRMLAVFLFVSFAWIFFRIPTFSQACSVISSIFTSAGPLFIDKHVMSLFLFSFLVMFIKDLTNQFFPNVKVLYSDNRFVSGLTCIALIVSILLVGKLDAQSFIYFQF